ncbi:ferredoxin [Rhodococcus sp. WS4]|nr:MAG: ferredoxin [Rhodococcus sp. (in: high G+C Gram-positive bacteria)]TQC41495.1 ferredoxin [Rhodococcus sp. WS4]
MHVTIEQNRCIGAGQCVLNAPEVFDQREDDGIVELLDETPAEDLHKDTRLAARLCPADAIFVHEK